MSRRRAEDDKSPNSNFHIPTIVTQLTQLAISVFDSFGTTESHPDYLGVINDTTD